MQKILDERPGNIIAPPRTKDRLRKVTLQLPDFEASELAAAVEAPTLEGTANACEEDTDVGKRRMAKRSMTMTLRPCGAMSESGKVLVHSCALQNRLA